VIGATQVGKRDASHSAFMAFEHHANRGTPPTAPSFYQKIRRAAKNLAQNKILKKVLITTAQSCLRERHNGRALTLWQIKKLVHTSTPLSGSLSNYGKTISGPIVTINLHRCPQAIRHPSHPTSPESGQRQATHSKQLVINHPSTNSAHSQRVSPDQSAPQGAQDWHRRGGHDHSVDKRS
jgi:hypothetical protein